MPGDCNPIVVQTVPEVELASIVARLELSEPFGVAQEECFKDRELYAFDTWISVVLNDMSTSL